MEHTLNEGGNNISDWYNNNLLQGDFSKYQAMSLGPRNCTKDLRIEINDTEKSEIMLLGVTLDDQLTFSSHVSNICRKTSCQIGVLQRLCNLIPTSAKLHIANLQYYLMSHTVKLSGTFVVLLMPES